MSKSAPRLGKGLSALIAPRETHFTPTPPDAPAGAGRQLPIDSIRVNPRQPRTSFDTVALEQLAASIRTSGVLQPILVRPLGEAQFELIAGERRWRAARLAGLQQVPALVRAVGDAESLELALIENLQREDLNPLERASAYRQYIQTFSTTIEELARRLGESRANVSNYMRLLDLSEDIKHLLEAGQLGMGQARAIAGLSDPQRQLALARLTVRRNLSVRQVEALTRGDAQPALAATMDAKPQSRHMQEVEDAFGRALGVPVTLVQGKRKNSGRIVIQYRNLEEFDLIAERLGCRAELE